MVVASFFALIEKRSGLSPWPRSHPVPSATLSNKNYPLEPWYFIALVSRLAILWVDEGVSSEWCQLVVNNFERSFLLLRLFYLLFFDRVWFKWLCGSLLWIYPGFYDVHEILRFIYLFYLTLSLLKYISLSAFVLWIRVEDPMGACQILRDDYLGT